ncbi:NnrU family protein [Devosia sp. RR2S18]|uniref:NnrU family protein n=1 Tax=Devosia rhizosphaerae TaxID=3049774 RepID=UPI00253FAAF0|nr:NnrU family protein [Devosia sp. RR2S18]WIJ26970.1 NnrU family protein [Devosia sp. RR2S18]
MTQFIFALAVFLLLHSVPSVPAIRQRLIAALGRRAYLVLYSVVSVASLAWVFHAALRIDYIELWSPAAWHAWVPLVFTPIAFFLLLSGLLSPNPISVSMRKGSQPGAIVSVTRHPVLWGFVLWAVSHVVANGDLRALLLFGTLALFGVFGIVMTERRSSKRQEPSLQFLKQETSIVPFLALAQRRARLRVDPAMLVAFILTVLLTAWLLIGGHAVLFGADPLAMAQV